MVIVAFEMISDDMAQYLISMDPIDRELMVLDNKINKVFNELEAR